MNLKAIRSESRFRLGDESKPYLWSDKWLDKTINESEREACIRARLIEDKSSNVTSIDITTTEKRYALSPLVIDVLSVELESNPDVEISGWTLTETEIVFSDYPKADDVLLMTVIRMPLNEMDSDASLPEIRGQYHELLIDWVEHRAFSVIDADKFDPNRSAIALDRFEKSFGKRFDANVQRKHRQKVRHVVRMNPF